MSEEASPRPPCAAAEAAPLQSPQPPRPGGNNSLTRPGLNEAAPLVSCGVIVRARAHSRSRSRAADSGYPAATRHGSTSPVQVRISSSAPFGESLRNAN